ncbi:MAG: DUF2877 domain-containing protein [Anaerolineae bacterium]|nr:DUF2877 domain-containing protein [Anaerolineae bacterium]
MTPARLEAFSLSPKAKNWINASGDARLLHVFTDACNLINARGEVLSLVNPIIGNGPFSVIVENATSLASLDIQSSVSLNRYNIQIGEFCVDVSRASLWEASPNWEHIHAHRDNICKHLPLLESLQKASQPSESMAVLPGPASSTSITPITRKFHENIENLIKSIQYNDFVLLADSSQNLIGLGIGLTPAGDDFLVGLMLGLQAILGDPAEQLCQLMVRDIQGKTTSLSAAWLHAAACGEAGEVWHDFLFALTRSDDAAVESRMRKILSIGHTSGSDALAGFLQVVQIMRMAA